MNNPLLDQAINTSYATNQEPQAVLVQNNHTDLENRLKRIYLIKSIVYCVSGLFLLLAVPLTTVGGIYYNNKKIVPIGYTGFTLLVLGVIGCHWSALETQSGRLDNELRRSRRRTVAV